MIRFVLIVLAIVAVAWLLVRIARDARQADLDWRGVAFAAGFVALAIYLGQTTGIGGI